MGEEKADEGEWRQEREDGVRGHGREERRRGETARVGTAKNTKSNIPEGFMPSGTSLRRERGGGGGGRERERERETGGLLPLG